MKSKERSNLPTVIGLLISFTILLAILIGVVIYEALV